MSSYLRGAATKRHTSQSEPIPGSSQAENNAGGFAWEIAPLERLRRFLILGSEGGSYYANEGDLTRQNVDGVLLALDEHGVEAVQEIVQVSENGRAAKNDAALYVLALAAAHPSVDVRRAALDALPRVARTGTHLFQFLSFVESHRGWGRALRRAVSDWYVGREPHHLAYQAIKYRQREGWAHRDALRLAHPGAPSDEHRQIYDWLCGRLSGLGLGGDALKPIAAFSEAQVSKSPEMTAKLVRQFGSVLPREALNPEHLKSPLVWDAILDAGMPMAALIRNLATMTRVGLIAPMSAGTEKVCEQISDGERLREAKVHPLAVLVAMLTYAQGRGVRGGNTWKPIQAVVDALDGAFYEAFGNVEPTGKSTLLALDVSGSMGVQEISGMPGVTPMVGAAAMALITASTEPRRHVLGFSDRLVEVPISPRQRLTDVVRTMRGIPMGRTDCALPMLWALQAGAVVDAFVIYTDSETYHGDIHPAQALAQYRRETGIDAKLVVVGMVSNGFSIADPNDAGMLDVVGFDTVTPQVISAFTSGA